MKNRSFVRPRPLARPVVRSTPVDSARRTLKSCRNGFLESQTDLKEKPNFEDSQCKMMVVRNAFGEESTNETQVVSTLGLAASGFPRIFVSVPERSLDAGLQVQLNIVSTFAKELHQPDILQPAHLPNASRYWTWLFH